MKTIMVILLVGSLFTIDKMNHLENPGQQEKWDEAKEQEFIEEAASGGRMEMLLGNLVKEKVKNDEVRVFAEMMVQDHAKANAGLNSAIQEAGAATGRGLLDKHQKKIDEISEASADNLDKKYMDMMVEDHEEDVKKFKEASEKVSDERLRMWVTSTLPVLEMHLQEAKKIRESLK